MVRGGRLHTSQNRRKQINCNQWKHHKAGSTVSSKTGFEPRIYLVTIIRDFGYIDIPTGSYTVFSGQDKADTPKIEMDGRHFFEDAQQKLLQVVYPPDREKVSRSLTREQCLDALMHRGGFTLDYHLLFDGQPLEYRLKAFFPDERDRDHFMIGTCSVEGERTQKEKFASTQESSVTFARIAQALSQDFFTIYYVNMVSGQYMEYSMHGPNHQLQLVRHGEAFFEDCLRDIPDRVDSADRERVLAGFERENLIKAVEGYKPYSLSYQVLVDGEYTHVQVKVIRLADDPEHLVVGMSNIDEQVRMEKEYEAARAQSVTYGRIAQALAGDYFSIYYVDIDTDRFVEFSAHSDYRDLGIEQSGEDFFALSRRNGLRVVYPEDQHLFMEAFTKENILAALEKSGVFTLSYRLVLDGVPNYVAMKAIRMEDGDEHHIVVGVSNIHSEVQRQQESVTYASIAEALAADYFSIYYVDLETEKFIEYSSHEVYEDLDIEKGGDDFFALSRNNIMRVVHPEDRERFLGVFTKENLIRELDTSGTFTLTYRLMFADQPTYVQMKATRMADRNDPHIVIGVNNIDAQMRRQQDFDRAQEENLTYSGIANALAADYFSIYYVDLDTDEFLEYSATETYQSLGVEQKGTHFFDVSRKNGERLIHPQDRQMWLSAMVKENLVAELEKSPMFTMNYRLLFGDKPVWVSMKVTRLSGGEDNHIVIGVNNIDAQMQRKEAYERAHMESQTYSRIAQALARDYYSVYLVNTRTDEFVEYSSNAEYQELQVEQSGKDFFEDCRRNVIRLVHPDDLKKALMIWDKANLMAALESGQTISTTYRLMFDEVPVYINCKVLRMTGDGQDDNIVIGVSNIDAQMKREAAFEEELQTAKELASRDALTGVKSKHAFVEAEERINRDIAEGREEGFGVVVCDVNGLKQINDNLGHKAGDRHIQKASEIICHIFQHSPVYRIGGDEFVVIMHGSDYARREELMADLTKLVEENQKKGEIVIASGISEYVASGEEKDTRIETVFERADSAMYVEKKRLKGIRE
ncbi:MAG: GGDEF domain-containing protein [Clostridia bacterium]|nr:GGDEF domain-containing protein [Clostridia bacterium]